MQEFFAKYSIQICTFMCAWVIYPIGRWINKQLKEKDEFKGQLSALETKVENLDRKVEHNNGKTEVLLQEISKSITQIEINTAVNTSKLDNK